MIHGLLFSFLLLSAVFALTHQLAMEADLYWYLWWFDVVMHFWGGLLIGLGVQAGATLSWPGYRPSLPLLLLVLALLTGLWEVFEAWAGLHDPDTFIVDTTQDVLLGFGGGILMYSLIARYKMKDHGKN